ncbi:MAG TPA: hypothetical protein VGP76_05850 [Planctomycetaceae bacterium]|jgi:hypothetical protein|nr:hypothetical protein [Planctomycetaceae bacterium]
MSDEPKSRSQGKGLSRTWTPVTLFTVLAAYQGAHYLPAQQPSPKPITLGALVEAMEAREKLADSAMLRWNESERYAAGALRKDPSEFTFACEMLLEGLSMRYVGKSFSHHAGGDVTLVDHVSSYDGNESRFLQGATPPRGRILQEKANTDARLYALMPFRLYFRPLAEPYGTLERKSLKLLDQRKTVDGHACVAVDDGRLRVHLDCDRDFVPVAYQTFGGKGILHFEGKIEYYRADKGPLRWLPKAFQVTSPVPGFAVRTQGDSVQTTIGVPFALAGMTA